LEGVQSHLRRFRGNSCVQRTITKYVPHCSSPRSPDVYLNYTRVILRRQAERCYGGTFATCVASPAPPAPRTAKNVPRQGLGPCTWCGAGPQPACHAMRCRSRSALRGGHRGRGTAHPDGVGAVAVPVPDVHLIGRPPVEHDDVGRTTTQRVLHVVLLAPTHQ